MVVAGLNQGMQPIAGYNYGARQYHRVMEVYLQAAGWATLVCIVGWFFSVIVPGPAVRMFTNDPELIDRSEKGLRMMNMFLPVIGFQMVSTNFFQSLGMVGKSIFLSLTRQLLFLVPAVYFLPTIFDIKGVWYGFPVSDLLACITTLVLLVPLLRKFHSMKDGDDPSVLGSTIK